MGTTTLASLEQELSENIGDRLSVPTSTNITTDNSVICSTLNQYDGGQDEYFNGWWCFIDGTNNANVLREISDYATATGTLTVRGAALSAETGSVTVTLHRYDRAKKIIAIQRAIDYVFPAIFVPVDDFSLSSGNILPDGSFEWWPTSSTLTFYTAKSNVSIAKNTTAGQYRGVRGSTSATVTATGASGYMSIHSDEYPRLLDLMGKNASIYVWASPQTADDAVMTLYTKTAAGTAQTLSTTTASPAGEFTRLKLENQSVSDDLVEVEVRFTVTTSGQYCYFDDAIVVAGNLKEYVVPFGLQPNGHISQAMVQADGYSDQPSYDIRPKSYESYQFRVVNDGTYDYLRLKDTPTNNRTIRLRGYKPLNEVSAETDTIEIDGPKLDPIVFKAAELLYRLVQGPVSSEDKSRYYGEIGFWRDEYNRSIAQHTMMRPADTLYTG